MSQTRKNKAFKLTHKPPHRKYAKINLGSVEKVSPLKRKWEKNFYKFKDLEAKVGLNSNLDEDLMNLDLHFKDSKITLNLKKPQNKKYFNSLILTQKLKMKKNQENGSNIGYFPKLFTITEKKKMENLRMMEEGMEVDLKSFKKNIEESIIDSESLAVIDKISENKEKKRDSRTAVFVKLEMLNNLITKDANKKINIRKNRKKELKDKRKRRFYELLDIEPKNQRGRLTALSLDDIGRKNNSIKNKKRINGSFHLEGFLKSIRTKDIEESDQRRSLRSESFFVNKILKRDGKGENYDVEMKKSFFMVKKKERV